MIRTFALALAVCTSLFFVSPSFAADPAAGKAKAATCTACHGSAGISSNPEWPNLAGQKSAYVVEQLKEFKTGARKSALMAPQAKGLSNDEIANLAAYFSSLKCSP